ncbi:hypothetical protein F9K77_16725 [Ochrobactrum sp. LMG 5442]|nr:hypothetical protein F9K77_16725 [Ochrobactrum sp. LMG 5442]
MSRVGVCFWGIFGLHTPQCLIQKSPCLAANGDFLRFRCSCTYVHCAPVLENHHFRHGLTLFDSDTQQFPRGST